MDDFLILLQAKLDEAKSKGNINADIEKLQGQLDKLKIQATLDPKSAQNLADEIGKLVNQKIVISNIDIDTNAVTKNAQKTGQEIGKQIQSGVNSVIQKGNFKAEFTFSADKQNNVAKIAQEEFKKIANGIVTVKEEMKKTDTGNFLDGFVVNIKKANGEVESLTYRLRDMKDAQGQVTGKSFQYTGGSINDNGVIKQINDIENAFADYTQKLAQFKDTNKNILSGLSAPLANFEEKLQGLRNGTSTIDDVRNSFKLLDTDAKEITSNLSAQFNKVDAAVRGISKGEETISVLRAELKGLNNTPKEINSELSKLSTGLQNIKKIEAQERRTANWSKAYSEWEQSVKSLTEKIRVLKKEQANSASTQILNTNDLDKQEKLYVLKVRNTIAKVKSELESKLRNAGYMDIEIKGVEDTTGKVKSLTATVTDATGAFKQLNFERTKMQKDGKAQDGFVQSDNVKVLGDISKSVVKVQNNLISLKSNWEEQGILVGEFKSKVDTLETSLSSVGSKGELENFKVQIKALKDETSTIAQVNKIQLSIETGGYESKVESLIAKTRQWTDENGNARISSTALSTALDNLNIASNNLVNNNTVENQKALISAEKELKTQIDSVTNSVRSMNAETMKSSAVDNLKQKYQQFYDLNGKSHRQFGAQMKAAMLELSSGAEVSIQRGRELERQLVQINNTCRQTGKLGKTWFQTIREGMSSFSYWTSSTFLVMKAIQSVKGGLSTVRELDTALVDLKKTTTMTNSELEEFYYESNKVAKQMGVTTEEIINQAAAWSRLGFSSAEAATKMAQLSSKFASISPGMSTDESQEGLVSIIKAWGLNVDEIEREVMDNINTLGNKFAESNIDLVNGMKRSAAALASTGTSYQEAFALFTGAQEVLQNAEVAGRGLRSVSMRIRGYSENSEDGFEELDEELKNITGDLIDLTKTAEHSQGVSVFKEGSTTEFKSLVEYFGEIHDIWDEMSQVQQNSFLDKAFGKNQANKICLYVQKCA